MSSNYVSSYLGINTYGQPKPQLPLLPNNTPSILKISTSFLNCGPVADDHYLLGCMVHEGLPSPEHSGWLS